MNRLLSIAKPVALLLTIPALLWLLAKVLDYRLAFEPRSPIATETIVDFAPAAGDALMGPWPQDFVSEADSLILLIGDGMGFSQVLAARIATAGMDGRLTLERLPITGWATTFSTGRLYTDSAAGATALATGHRTKYLHVGTDSDGNSLPTLFEAAAAAGKAVGLVTDSYLWDATPASFAAHRATRRDLDGIASDMAGNRFDLLIGEEHPRFEDDEGEKSPGLNPFRSHGYRIATDHEDLVDAVGQTESPVIGLLASGTIAGPESSTLPALARMAIQRLAANPNGFVLMIETEETDTASHRHDFERMVKGVHSLDQVATIAADHVREDRQTILVTTADHETGGLTLLAGRQDQPLAVHWSTSSHSGSPVPVFAYGPGAEQLGGVRDNFELPQILARLLSLDLGGQRTGSSPPASAP